MSSHKLYEGQQFLSQTDFDETKKIDMQETGATYIIANSNGKNINLKWEYTSFTLNCVRSGNPRQKKTTTGLLTKSNLSAFPK